MTIKLSFFGAAGCVTGSCTLLETATARVLVDCGMFQGPKTLKSLNYGPFPFDAASIDAVLLTHAHIDHSGLLPKLALAGFSGRIIATRGTLELCRVLLPDAAAIQEMEVEALNRRTRRRGGADVAPIFTGADAEAALALFQTTPLKTWIEPAPGMRARFWNAGHILGAASIEVEADGQSVLFSGDVGPGGRDFAKDPEGPNGVDHIVLESTYGGTDRAPLSVAERRQVLARELLAAHAAGGPLLMPAFAVERTQELIVDLLELMEANLAPPGPIFLDSPLAIRASDTFLRHGHFGNGVNPFARLAASPWLRYTESVAESRAIERMHGWHVIVAASGMCDAGRVRHHLKRLLWREEPTLLLTGFQPIGTLGRLLQDGRRAVRIQGDDIKVRARIRSIDVYSGHADAAGLMAWAKARSPRGNVLLNHGEPENRDALARRLTKSGFDQSRIIAVDLDQTYRLKPSAKAEIELRAPRVRPAAVARLDWHNRRSEFITRLNASLEQAADDATREHLISTLLAQLDTETATSSANSQKTSPPV